MATKNTTTGDGSARSTAQPKNKPISRDDWLRAVEEAGYGTCDYDQDSLTSAELGVLWGVAQKTAQDRLVRMRQQGLAEMTKKRVKAADGYWRIQASWRLVRDGSPR